MALESGVSIPDTAFVFAMHQGCAFVFFRLGEGDDPPVYLFEEVEQIKALEMSFSAWFSRAADDEIRLTREQGG